MRISLLLTPCSDHHLQLAAQIGVTDIVAVYPGLVLADLMETKRRVESWGMRLSVIERHVPTLDFIHGVSQRDQQIADFITLIRNMGEAGVRVLCYSWMPDDDWQRTDLAFPDRGGALVSAFDMRDPANFRSVTGFDFRNETPTPAARLWDNLEYFLNAVIPVAEEAGVKLAMHPDDPPIGALHGQERILTVSSLVNDFYGIRDVCLSLPSVVNEKGVVKTVNLTLNDTEQQQLIHSAQVLRDIFDTLVL